MVQYVTETWLIKAQTSDRAIANKDWGMKIKPLIQNKQLAIDEVIQGKFGGIVRKEFFRLMHYW
jgi:hypothetical protein